jgi:hypothetical protein
MTPQVELKPASAYVPEILAALTPVQRLRLSRELENMSALTTAVDSYVSSHGRATVEAFILASHGIWRGATATRINGTFRANLRSGSHRFGLVRLLGDRLD